MTEKQKQLIAKRYREGETSGTLAKEFGIHRVTVLNIARKYAIKIHPIGRPLGYQFPTLTKKQYQEILYKTIVLGRLAVVTAKEYRIRDTDIEQLCYGSGYVNKMSYPDKLAELAWYNQVSGPVTIQAWADLRKVSLSTAGRDLYRIYRRLHKFGILVKKVTLGKRTGFIFKV